MRWRNPLQLWQLYHRSRAALQYARSQGIPGLEFADYGRSIGKQLLLKRSRNGFGYLITPVSITRYFEFSFTLNCLPQQPGRCLDISSPRLFSLYVADKVPLQSLKIINPDLTDLTQTRKIAVDLGLKRISTEHAAVDILAEKRESYDCTWSISVIEHIAGGYDDTFAVKLMYDALAPGGRLILTMPVDRKHWDEFRETNYYQAHDVKSGRMFFFQRFYTYESIRQRILAPLDKDPVRIQWFGERVSGRFHEYVQRWMRDGQRCTVEDPREIADYYQEYASWAEMPGVGVCGLMIEK